MGKYKGIAKISGAWADVQLCIDGTARRKSSLTKEKWRTSPKMKLARESARVFGGAMAAAGATFSALPHEMRALARRLPHNLIASRLRSHHVVKGREDDAYTFEESLPALHGLDISQDRELSSRILIRAIGDPLQPKAIHIQGLRDAADAITQLPGHQLQFRLHFCFVEFPESRLRMDFEWYIGNDPFAHPQPASAWLSADLVPEVGLRMAVHTPNVTMPQLLFMGVEWRHVPVRTSRKQRLRPSHQNHAQVHPAGGSTSSTASKPRRNARKEPQGWGILKLVALFRPAQDIDLPRPAFLHPRRNAQYRPTNLRRFRPNFSAMTPEMRLRRAMPILGTTNANRNAHVGFLPVSPGKSSRTKGQEMAQYAGSSTMAPKVHRAATDAAPDQPAFNARSTALPRHTLTTHSPHVLHRFSTSGQMCTPLKPYTSPSSAITPAPGLAENQLEWKRPLEAQAKAPLPPLETPDP